MQVKVFEAPDMNSGLKMVKEALGSDALILSTRTIHNGKFGVLGKATLEITAAIDIDWQEKAVHPSLQSRRRLCKHEDKKKEVTYKNIRAAKDTAGAVYSESEKEHNVYKEKPDNIKMKAEISELRTMVDSLSQKINNPSSTESTLEPRRKKQQKQDFPAVSIPKTEREGSVMQMLTSCGLNQQMAEIVTRFTKDAFNGDLDNIDPVPILTDAIARLFTVNTPLARRLTRQKRICLIGPTGVGKTTTIAKLAAGYLKRFGGKIAMITIDTYRIAAVEQLKVYGEIMDIPVEVVIKPEDMSKALEKHSGCDLILIDTAGRSPENSSDIKEMASFLCPEYSFEYHLMLAATSREQELKLVIDSFSYLGLDNFIFSKIDECSQLGVLLNIHYFQDTPISFLTNGQRVPEDIIEPAGKMIAELIINKCQQTGSNQSKP